jgi:hypothetical protein
MGHRGYEDMMMLNEMNEGEMNEGEKILSIFRELLKDKAIFNPVSEMMDNYDERKEDAERERGGVLEYEDW